MKSILQGLEINCDDGNPKFTNMPTASPDKSQTQSPATTAPVPIPTATPVLTTSNPTKSPISQPTTLPSTSPVQALSQSPTVFEVLSEAPSDVAVEESIAPTKTPVARPQSLPIQPVPNTTTVPIPTQKSKAPSSSPREENLSQCQLNSACAARNLTGQCCPTTDDWTLACCGAGPVEELCQGNDKCAALELTGSCCPTTDGKHLDCCEVVPDACLLNGTDSAECQRYSTTQYKLELRQKSNSSESSTGHANMSSRSLLLLLFCLPSFALALNNYL